MCRNYEQKYIDIIAELEQDNLDKDREIDYWKKISSFLKVENKKLKEELDKQLDKPSILQRFIRKISGGAKGEK